MHHLMRYLSWLVFLGCAGLNASADEKTILRYLEFRDGSILHLPVMDQELPVTILQPEGGFATRPIRLSEMHCLKFAPQREFTKKKAILAAVEKLGSDDFAEREQSQENLMKMGTTIRSDLQVALQMFSDVEIQYRLRQILKKCDATSAKSGIDLFPFDRITLGDSFWGDAGDGEFSVILEGIPRKLSRLDVAGITEQPPDSSPLPLTHPGASGLFRLGEKDFPPGCIEEGFETAPDGRKLSVGENIEKLFIPKGFVLSTSIKDSFVSVNNFLVNGKSGGLSAATHQPLYHGEITIRFVQPGLENVPAGVTYFGCWMAVVMPKGTALVAYDLQGREIGSIQTERGPHEFMGIHSSVPMNQIHVVPNLEIDPDYTLDDFIFSVPQVGEVRHPEKFTVELTQGERILCQEVQLTSTGIQIKGLPARLPDCIRPLNSLVRVIIPTKGSPDHPGPPGIFAELIDGSVLFGELDKTGFPVFSQDVQLNKNQAKIVGLWKADFPRLGWPGLISLPVIWDLDKKAWQKIADVQLTPVGVTYTLGGKQQAVRYRDVAALLLKPPGSSCAGSWHVRTTFGEDFQLDSSENGHPLGKMPEEMSATWQGKPLKIPAKEVVSVYRVLRNGP